eukprot:c27376_g2_i2 orf=225-386(+)
MNLIKTFGLALPGHSRLTVSSPPAPAGRAVQVSQIPPFTQRTDFSFGTGIMIE